jgi:amidohydrolase
VAAAQIVSAIQTIVSRNVDPQKTAVLTTGTIHGGTAFNIIPDLVELTGTIRTFDAAERDKILERLEALSQGVASAMGAEAQLEVNMLTPAVVNDRAATDLMRDVAESVLGNENVHADFRTMGSEDMAFFLREVPGTYMFLGSANAESGLDFPHHNPRFDIDEGVLSLGVAVLTETSVRFLSGG